MLRCRTIRAPALAVLTRPGDRFPGHDHRGPLHGFTEHGAGLSAAAGSLSLTAEIPDARCDPRFQLGAPGLEIALNLVIGDTEVFSQDDTSLSILEGGVLCECVVGRELSVAGCELAEGTDLLFQHTLMAGFGVGLEFPSPQVVPPSSLTRAPVPCPSSPAPSRRSRCRRRRRRCSPGSARWGARSGAGAENGRSRNSPARP
ncbi:MAG: hypothetical protein AAFR52_01465 [Pseudomonadota bacterium]